MLDTDIALCELLALLRGPPSLQSLGGNPVSVELELQKGLTWQ
jgi:hypothetical protein